jgi:hypothetical protein
LARSIFPFALLEPSLIILPITIEQDALARKVIRIHSVDELRAEGFLNAARWFRAAEEIWQQRRTNRNKDSSAIQYLNWRKKLTEQDLDSPYLVLYNSSAQDANATVIKRQELDLSFIVDHVTYVFTTARLSEAYYLTAVLNSNIPNALMKDFQARGSFGARHVHKKNLDVYFPYFDQHDQSHKRVAELSELAHARATKFLEANLSAVHLTAIRLGRVRVDLKKEVKAEMKEIDALLKQIIQLPSGDSQTT